MSNGGTRADTVSSPMATLFARLGFGPDGGRAPVVAVLRLGGVIGSFGPLRRGLTLAQLAQPIERAFAIRRLRAIALAVNSPGGSAAQAALIAGRIRALAGERGVPVYAFVEDVAASGGYWLACAADEIFATNVSVVGSIGVVSAGFGFADLLRRLGVERRLHTAGVHKGMLDPFLDERPDHVERLGALQADVHEAFKAFVRSRRAARLAASEDELFSGAFWSGRRALEMGLIDGLGEMRSVLRERFGERVRFRPVTVGRAWWRQRHTAGAANAFGGDRGEGLAALAAAVEERILWARFGL